MYIEYIPTIYVLYYIIFIFLCFILLEKKECYYLSLNKIFVTKCLLTGCHILQRLVQAARNVPSPYLSKSYIV